MVTSRIFEVIRPSRVDWYQKIECTTFPDAFLPENLIFDLLLQGFLNIYYKDGILATWDTSQKPGLEMPHHLVVLRPLYDDMAPDWAQVEGSALLTWGPAICMGIRWKNGKIWNFYKKTRSLKPDAGIRSGSILFKSNQIWPISWFFIFPKNIKNK